ncbi:MAG: 50S ribosomal protein L1 [Dehalococcoidia bacterium]|nr:50S ribosomal protein L1 [Dehalococcoidia bacterium]
MTKRSKRYMALQEKVDAEKSYSPQEAVDLLKEVCNVKFDETVEIHLRTGADPRHADQLVRGVTILPYGLGKQVRVLVFANGEAAELARQAGADYVGEDDLIQQIEGGWTEFDVGLAVPDVMSKIGRLGRVLGRRGLMPNPRTGLPRIIEEANKGRLEYRMDRTAIIHSPVGKISFPQSQLLGNTASVVDAVVKSRPAAVKGAYIRSAYLSSSMGPSVKLDLTSLLALKPDA